MGGKLTPAMKQYMDIKNKHKDCIVFFRMGDFYETFYEDAKTTSKALDIALTKRGIKNSDQSIPLAGIPYHSLDSYLGKMIKQGYKIAIVEQMEDPKEAKGIVKRDVSRIVTPGTVIDQNLISKNNNYIATLSIGKDNYGISFVDMSTGEFFTTELENFDNVMIELLKHNPSELILPLSFENSELSKKIESYNLYISYVSDVDYYQDNAKKSIKKHFNVFSLEGFGLKQKDLAISASGAALSYLHNTQKNSLSHINSVKFYSKKDYLDMDITTIKNLELLKNIRENTEEGTLLKILDKTLTPMGSRLLTNFLLKPLLDITKINERLLAVEEFINKPFTNEELRDLLKNISDLERLISRINYGNSNPRDLVFLHGSLELIPEVKNLLNDVESVLLNKLANMDPLPNISRLIDDSIMDDPPANIAEGNFIKKNYNEELDDLREISFSAKKIIKEIEEKERLETGIKSLKIRYNRVFGYYIDVTKRNLSLVPEHYIKKQTLVNSERFITEELKELEEKILTADEKIIILEKQLFDEIVDIIKKETVKIQDVADKIAYLDVLCSADKIAYLDVLCSFGIVSLKNNYVRPMINNEFKLRLKNSRHPVVEKITDFIPNTVDISPANNIMIITGPNMAGKSVFMRQIALNVIMAQIGCFVAADAAELGVIDKIFCRTGAIDDISHGQSTFMVEMSETAQILNNATSNSLIILDEIGRGTSTYDGVAIAWAVAEHIAKNIKAKTMFATHYHVLNNLEKEVKGVKNYNIAVEEKENKVIFLRKIVEGGTNKSYGIHVAKLAGMPQSVIDKSREIQFKLEQEDEISEKIIIETRKTKEKDEVREEVEEVDRLIKSKQLTLDEL